jgi:GAF domain-containing protein
MSDLPIPSSLASLSRFLLGEMTLAQTLTRVAELTQAALPAARSVGLTLHIDGRDSTPIFSNALAPEIDEAQYEADDGPCLSAFRERQRTAIADTAEPGRWEAFRAAALARGIRSTLSLPLLVAPDRAVGAMNLYAGEPEAFTGNDSHTGEMFATQAAIVLANAQSYWDARQLSDDLSQAMHSRAVIEQAKGILMGAEGITADEAFAMLVTASQRENRKLRDIASRIVTNTTNRPPRRDLPSDRKPL